MRVRKSSPEASKSSHFLAHPTDIFSLAVTPTQILSASGASSIRVYDTTGGSFALAQVLERAHPLGCHHVVTSKNGQVAASVGFGGEVKIWRTQDGAWVFGRKIVGTSLLWQYGFDHRPSSD